MPGSSAIDGTSTNCPSTDQRGVARSQGAGCDIGAFESQGFTLAITGGNNQNTLTNAAFTDPLSLSITANDSSEPVNGGKITFTPPASGASAVITGSPATISDGAVSVTAAANGASGSYDVVASATGAASVSFSLTNDAAPAPEITGLNPLSISTGGADLTLTVNGTNFVDGATARWNGAARTTAYVSATELSVTIPAADLATTGVAYLTVLNPDGGISNPQAFYITPPGVAVTASDTGSDGEAVIDAPNDFVKAQGEGSGVLSVAIYDSNPAGTPSFAASNAYINVNIAPGSSFDSLMIVDCHLNGGDQVYWWDGSAWALVQYQNPAPNPPGCMLLMITANSSPSLADLSGTVFAAGTPALAPTITGQPEDVAAFAGEDASFTSTADGIPTPTVQWQVSTDDGTTWTDIEGATSTTLTLNDVTFDQNGNQYRAVFTNGIGDPAISNAATLTVGKQDQTITFGALADKTYGDEDFDVTATASSGLTVCFAASGECTISGNTIHISGAGNCTVTASQAGNDEYNPAEPVSQSFTITPRPITVTADARSKLYGANDPVLSFTYSPELVGTEAFTGALSREPGENVGAYTIEQGTLALGDNYTLTYTGADFTITPRHIEVTADTKSKVYGALDPELTYQITQGTLAFDDEFTGSLAREAGEEIGTYAIQQGTLALNDNYTLTFLGADFTITRRALTVTADAKTKVYGEADPTLTYQITAGSLMEGDSLSGELSREAGENVGTYAIGQGTLTAGDNYILTFEGADLTITPKSASVTPDAAGKTYGDDDPILTGTLIGFLAGDGVTANYNREAGQTVGSYIISASLSPAGVLSNYDITYKTATFTIDKKVASVTPDAASKTYGQADPSLSGTLTGFLPGDGVMATYSRETGESVGAYDISAALSPTEVLGNYDITYNTADFTINKATLTVTAGDQNKVYGNDDPALTYQVTGLVEGDSLSGALNREAGENVGVYAIEQGGLTASDNYNLTFVGADFTITARPIEVTADAKSKVYGAPDPALIYQITSGSLAFEDAFTGALTRVAGEDVGSYAILQGTLALNDNYNLTYVGTDFTIGLANTATTLTVSQSTVLQGQPVTFTAVVAPVSPASGVPTGTVNFMKGTTVLAANVALVDGQAQFVTSDLSGGVVFYDQNGNGTRNSGDWGLSGWTVQLTNASGNVLQTKTTGSNGSYSFTGLAVGAYRVREVVKTGYVQTSTNPADITLASGQTRSGINFGNVISADLNVTMTAQYNASMKRIVYTITVRNDGPASAVGAFMTDSLPSGVNFISVNTTDGWCSGGKNVKCILGVVSPGESATITLIVKRTDLRRAIVNTATVGSLVFDIEKNDNKATVSVP